MAHLSRMWCAQGQVRRCLAVGVFQGTAVGQSGSQKSGDLPSAAGISDVYLRKSRDFQHGSARRVENSDMFLPKSRNSRHSCPGRPAVAYSPRHRTPSSQSPST